MNNLLELKNQKKNWYSLMVWMAILACAFVFFTACCLLDTVVVCKTSAICPNLLWGLGGFIITSIIALFGFNKWHKVSNKIYGVELAGAIESDLEKLKTEKKEDEEKETDDEKDSTS